MCLTSSVQSVHQNISDFGVLSRRLKAAAVFYSIHVFISRWTSFVMTHLSSANIATRKLCAASIFCHCTRSMVSVMPSIRGTSTPLTPSMCEWMLINMRFCMFKDIVFCRIRNQHFHDLFETDKKWALFFRPTQESKIFVHSHFENFGWDFRPHIVWEPDFAAELLISMKQTYTTKDAKQLSIGQRKCIFPDEIKLDIYTEEYTFTSCMKECRMKKSMKFCKCIAPFYPPIGKNWDIISWLMEFFTFGFVLIV